VGNKILGTFTPEGIYEMGVNTLKLNYIFWAVCEGKDKNFTFSHDVLPHLKRARGRTNTQRPRGETQILDSGKVLPAPAAQVEEIAVNHPDFQRALRITSNTRGMGNKWSVAARWLNREPAAAGDVLLMVFSLRCVKSPAADGKAVATVAFGTAGPPYRNCYVTFAKSDQEWKKHQFAFVSDRDYPPAQAKVSFGCGMETQTLEIGGVEVYNFGTTRRVADFQTSAVYQGIEEDAPWRKECLARIERIRKSPLEILVTDKEGTPVAGAKIHVAMQRHAFRFGSSFCPNIFGLEQRFPKEVAEYQRRFGAYFNIATPEAVMNWRSWEDPRQREYLSKTLTWLAAHDIPIIGHPMVWQTPKTLPERAQELIRRKDYAGYIRAWNEHLTEKVQAIRGRMSQYFVINEFVDTNFLPEQLTDDAILGWYKIVKAVDPRARLGILDHKMIGYGAVEADKNLPWYERTIEMLLRHKIPLELIAFQCHLADVLTDPQRVIEILDRFAHFGLELQVSEFDVDMDNEDLQAKYLRDFLIAVFSHPSVQVLQQWGFYEPVHWRPRAALFRKDWSPKPNGQAFLELVFRQWWTDVQGTTDSRGQYSVPAFHGDYQLTVTKGDVSRTVNTPLGKPGKRITVSL
jgi:endo-1,4-beta-xylanase